MRNQVITLKLGNGYLRAALDLISRAELDQAKDSLLLAARAFEKDESWRKIGALWERLALYIESNQTLEKTTVDSLIQHHVIGLETWQAQKDSHHKAAWAFQWAAQHVEGKGGPDFVSRLFQQAGLAAEKSSFTDRYKWAGMLFEKAAIYAVRNIATQEKGPDYRSLINKLEQSYKQIGAYDRTKKKEGYLCLTLAYRNIRLAFQSIGDTVTAEEFRRMELNTRKDYETSSGKRFQALLTWVACHPWSLLYAWSGSVFIVFPLSYWLTRTLAISGNETLTWYHHFSFSVLVATTSGFGAVTPVGILGYVVALSELLFSYGMLAVGVAVLVQWFRRLRGDE